MTKYGMYDTIKAPIHPMGADCALLHKRRLAHRLNPIPKMQPSEAATFWRGGARERKEEYP